MRKPIKREKLMAEINITPFTDVVLVLLIIFMITTPMLVQPGMNVNLPSAKTTDITTEKSIDILINAKGEIYLGKNPVSIEELIKKLQARVSANPDIPVVLKGDKAVQYESVIRVIDAAKQAGAKKFALAVEIDQK